MKKAIVISILTILTTGCLSVSSRNAAVPRNREHISIPVPANASSVSVKHNAITGSLDGITINFNTLGGDASAVPTKKTTVADLIPIIGPLFDTIENIFTGLFNQLGAKTKCRILIDREILPSNVGSVMSSQALMPAIVPTVQDIKPIK